MESDEKEKAAALNARRQMTTAALIISLSFVFVLVAVALIVLIGHIQLF